MVSEVSPTASLHLTRNTLIGSTEISYLLPAAILSVYDVVKQSRRVELCQHLVSIGGEADTTVCYHAIQQCRFDVLNGCSDCNPSNARKNDRRLLCGIFSSCLDTRVG